PTKKIASADFIFFLDFNSLQRIDKLGDEVEKSDAKKMIVDHHPQPSNFADFLYHDVQASSTAQLIYEFMDDMGYKKLLNKQVAECLYTGIMTDTGSFRFPSTTANTHRIVANLIDAGASGSDTYNKIFDDSTADKLKLMGYCLYEKMKVFSEYRTAIISLSAEEHLRFNYKKGDTEGLVNYCLAIRGIRFAAFFAERDGMVKTSFRSKGNFDVNKFARAHFNGGGHKNAAGGQSELTFDQTIDKFIGILPRFSKQLNSK
ncbi:MAG: DHH family phosphoesterase, partial [Bacteroidia bacterium]|nr:DHH family phosphoesterase [Bacteroidia bacterium]